MSGFPELGIAILAAGASRRMGQAKALMNWKGSSLLEHSIAAAKNLQAARIDVISGAYTEAFRVLPLWKAPIYLYHNHDWQEGMASSMRMAVNNAKKQPNLKGLMVMSVDQPLIPTGHLKEMATLFFEEPRRPVACLYAGSKGIPAIFPSAFFAKLEELRGDKGAGQLLNFSLQSVKTLSCPEAEWDIDTPGDWENLRGRWIKKERKNF
jgi:molybdenum cofactor cytidylyltransferase